MSVSDHESFGMKMRRLASVRRGPGLIKRTGSVRGCICHLGEKDKVKFNYILLLIFDFLFFFFFY